MSDDDLAKVIHPPIASKADAKRVLRLCVGITEAWKGYDTPEGFILTEDYDRAQAILNGVLDPTPGRKGFHDWDEIDRLIDLAAADMGSRVVRAEVCRRVSAEYPISATSSALRKRVSDRMKATGR